jgi:hypothetical protein
MSPPPIQIVCHDGHAPDPCREILVGQLVTDVVPRLPGAAQQKGGRGPRMPLARSVAARIQQWEQRTPELGGPRVGSP